MAIVLFKVQGMSCEHCVKTITQALTAVTGVDKVSVDLKPGEVTVVYEPAAVNIQTLGTAIADAGYEVQNPNP